jgi:hypothetical protein
MEQHFLGGWKLAGGLSSVDTSRLGEELLTTTQELLGNL